MKVSAILAIGVACSANAVANSLLRLKGVDFLKLSLDSKMAPNGAEDKSFFSPLNLSAPHTAAQAILGMKGSEAKSPGSTQQLAVGLLEGVDDKGKFKAGLSIAMGYRALTGNKPFTLERYRNGEWRRYNSQISVATAKGISDDSLQVSAGISVPIIDRTDWWKVEKETSALSKKILESATKVPDANEFYINEYLHASDSSKIKILASQTRENIKGLLENLDRPINEWKNRHISPSQVPAMKVIADQIKKDANGFSVSLVQVTEGSRATPTMEEWNDKDGYWRKSYDSIFQLVKRAKQVATEGSEVDFSKLAEKFAEEKFKEYWNKEKLQVSAGVRGFSVDGSYDSMMSAGTYLWGSYSKPMMLSGQSTLFVRYTHAERFTKDFPTTKILSNGYGIGGRLKWMDDNAGYSVEYLYEELEGASKKSVSRTYQFIFESKLSEKQWLVIGIGNSELGGRKGVGFLNLSMAFDFTEKPNIKP